MATTMPAQPTVGVLSPGDMGHAVGGVLHQHGLRVITCLEGRSERTRALAAEAGIAAVPSFEALVQESDIVLSILVPGRALDVAERVGAAIRATGAAVLFADCNAISPATAKAVGSAIQYAGGQYADAGIIGAPPPSPGNRIYTSGPGAQDLAVLSPFGLDVRVLDGPVGQASALKMCYAAMTKGLQALALELMVTARTLGVDETLRAEQQDGLQGVLNMLERTLPGMPPKAYRWVSEMEEIARTFEEVGLTPLLFQGAADVYRFVADTPIGHETPENRDRSRDMDGVIRALANALEARQGSPA